MARIKKLVTPDNPDTPEDESVYEEVEIPDTYPQVLEEREGYRKVALDAGTIREDF